jgi:hypothetical protein
MRRALPVTYRLGEGPFYVDQLRDGDCYELSRGHAILCAPTGKDHGRPHHVGALPLSSDPAVRDGGVDVGHALGPNTLRAPDLSIGDLGAGEGPWSTVAPPLAVEYAARGQDEADLQAKISELLAAGTRFVWVVRLTGPRRVEVYEAGRPKRVRRPGDRLDAPGVLKNAPLVEALYDREAAFEQTLQNLLERKGYASLEHVREQGKAEGLRLAIADLCELLGVALGPKRRARLEIMGAAELEALRLALKRHKRWPSPAERRGS